MARDSYADDMLAEAAVQDTPRSVDDLRHPHDARPDLDSMREREDDEDEGEDDLAAELAKAWDAAAGEDQGEGTDQGDDQAQAGDDKAEDGDDKAEAEADQPNPHDKLGAEVDDPEIKELLEPYREELKEHGVTGRQAVRRLFQAEQLMRSRPVDGIAWLAKTYGQSATPEARTEMARQVIIGLGLGVPAGHGQAGQGQQPDVDAKIDQRLAAHEQAQTHAQVTRQVEAFAKEHPDFNELRQTMAGLIQAGSAQDLESAYNQAKFGRDGKKLLGEQAEKERKASVAKAKTARTPRSKSAPARQNDEDLPLKDQLAKAYDQMNPGGGRY